MSLFQRRPPRAFACFVVLSLAALLGACAGVDPDGASGGGSASVARSGKGGGVAGEPVDEPLGAPARQSVRRGLGTITGRIPGTTQTLGGVLLVAHEVSVSVRDGFARTEIREEVRNDTDRVLEGRYTFPLPPGASVARLALWVGSELVEGEVVERGVASRIFRGIVEDTVRPRDPALLEWVSASELSLTIFPIPPHASRKVLLAYDQALPRETERVAYVLPLSLGDDKAPAIESFSVDVAVAEGDAPPRDVATPGYASSFDVEGASARIRFSAKGFVPKGDFVVSYPRAAAAGPFVVTAGRLALGEKKSLDREDFVAVRVVAEAPEAKSSARRAPIDRTVILDVSQSQSVETVAAEARLALALVRSLRPEDAFRLLACDSACESYPSDAPSARAPASMRAVAGWLGALSPRGSSDLAGALLAAVRPLRSGDRREQVVLIGDGSPSAGELTASSIATRARPVLAARGVELALLGVGRSVDEVVLAGLARELGGTYERVANGDSLEARAASIALGLERPVLADARLELPGGLSEPAPRALANLRLGQEVIVYARRTGSLADAKVALVGRIGERAYRREGTLSLSETAREVGAVPRLWAEARLAELAVDDSREAAARSIALSKRFHVMARGTAWLVLENDRMFAAFGIPRTVRPPSQSDDDRTGFVGPRSGLAQPDVAPGAGESLVGAAASGDAHARAPARVVSSASSMRVGQGFGSGSGRIGGAHRTRAPMIRMGATTVSGRLPPESIQRIVRLNFGRFRVCYERGLAKNPELAGRVVTKFVIGRDGAVSAASNAGSDLPDAEVISCIVRSFYPLAFPQPEGGIVTVTYPITFHSDGTRPMAPPREWPDTPATLSGPVRARPSYHDVYVGPSAVVAPATDAPANDGDAAIGKLRAALEAAPLVRARHEALIRGLLVRGRFDGALEAARRFIELDPDLPLARELLVGAFAATGDGASAARALDELVEAAPRSAPAHARAARAFEATGDERRACAHWRALAELRDDALVEALRCRVRVDGEREEALAIARAGSEKSPRLRALAAAIESGASPSYAPDGLFPGALEVSTQCALGPAACPSVLVVAPDGAVLSPFAPSSRARSGRGSVASPGVVDGTYRVYVVGSGGGDVTVRALGARRSFPFDGTGVHAVARVTVRSAG